MRVVTGDEMNALLPTVRPYSVAILRPGSILAPQGSGALHQRDDKFAIGCDACTGRPHHTVGILNDAGIPLRPQDRKYRSGLMDAVRRQERNLPN